jgi:SOS-response transcriptional repressor LexA
MAHQPMLTGRILGYRAVQVDRFIRQWTDENGQAPTLTIIMSELGIGSKGEVSRIVSSLERRGLLSRTGRGKVRRISIGAADANR